MTATMLTLMMITIMIQHIHSQVRYAIDNDNQLGRTLPFPIDICFQSMVLPDVEYIRYSCYNQGENLIKRVFPDEDKCNNGSADLADRDDLWSTSDTSPCNTPKFNCFGEDLYQLTSYWTNSGCSGNSVADIPVVIGCFCDVNNGQNISYSTNCTSSPLTGNLLTFNGNHQCSATANDTIDITQCYQTESNLGVFPLYAKITDCELNEPTEAPAGDDTESALKNLQAIYQVTAGGFVGFFGLIAVLSWIDAWVIRINDYYKISAIASMIVQTVDMMSDCFFVAELSIVSSDQDFILSILFLASIVFIVLPSFVALFQLYFYAKKHFLDSDYVRAWLSKYSTVLLIMALFTGSSFSAVALLNSYIFQIEIFDMGLTYKQLKGFDTRRIWSVVVLENLPQLILQSYYVYISDDISAITVSSIAFSVISIIITIMSITIEKTIRKTQRYVIITMDVTGDCVEERSSKCRTMSYKLRKGLGPLLGVDFNTIEIVKPMYITGGLSMDIIVYVNESRRSKVDNYDKILIEANENNKLPKLLQKAWILTDLPMISGIKHQTIESSQVRKQRTATHPEIENQIGLSVQSISHPEVTMTEQQSISSPKQQHDELKTNNNHKQGHHKQHESDIIQYVEQQNAALNAVKNGGDMIGRTITNDMSEGGNGAGPLDNEMEGGGGAGPNEEEPPPPIYNPNARPAPKRKNTKNRKNSTRSRKDTGQSVHSVHSVHSEEHYDEDEEQDGPPPPSYNVNAQSVKSKKG